jgi:hypothetical protein
MKRIQLIEIGILIVALIVGFKSIESLFSVIVLFLYQTMDDGRSGGWSFIIRYLVVAIIYFAAFLFLVNKTKWLAFYMNRQSDLKPDLLTEEPERINIRVQQTGLLYIGLVVLCISSIVAHLPALLIYVYDYFKEIVGGVKGYAEPIGESKEYIEFKTAAVSIIVTIVILAFAKPLAEWFTRFSKSGSSIIENNPGSPL